MPVNENSLLFRSHLDSDDSVPIEIRKTLLGIVGSICPIKTDLKHKIAMMDLINRSSKVV